MARDPYGFPDTPPGKVQAAGEASRAMWLGVISTILAATGLCACYVPYFIGAPMGFWAAWKGMKAAEVATDPRDKNMATAGMVSGILGGLVSGAFAAFITVYFVFLILYFVVIFFAVGIAAVSGQN